MADIPLTPWLDELARNLPVAREGRDPEGVHEVRVASRRLVTWLDLGGGRRCCRAHLRSDLRWLRNAAGAVRDLDVQLERVHPPGMAGWLQKRMATARPVLIEVLDDPRVPELLAVLAEQPPLDAEVAWAATERLVDRCHEAALDVGEPPFVHEDYEALHRLRRRVRPVRYALDWLGQKAGPVKRAQDALGLLNDAWVGVQLIRDWPGDAPEEEARLSESLPRLARDALAAWPAAEAFLERLLDERN